MDNNELKAIQTIDRMRETYGVETFVDFAGVCSDMKALAEATLTLNELEPMELDDVALFNLKNLQIILDVASKMFIQCDEYFR